MRNADPNVIAKRAALAGNTGPIGGNTGVPTQGPLAGQPMIATDKGGGGWGVSSPGAEAATGRWPTVNPWLIPKSSGLNVVSQTYPSNYFVEWDTATWRVACDRATKQGFTPDIATLYAWCYEASPFIQSMFRTVETAINSIPLYFMSKKGEVMQDWTQELCGKAWQMELKREIAFSFFWGFSGLNFDPFNEKLYKYPMQDIDPLNRFLRQSTYSFYDGTFFEDHDNLLFVQPNTNYEAFLGWMQPISRAFIEMNLNNANWLAAGKKLAFPVFTIGYPESNDALNNNGVGYYNPYKEEAQTIARDIGPGKAVVYPFTKMPNGEIQKNVEIQFEQTGASQKAHSIYQDFNEVRKNEIRELIMGGTLTADVGDSGSRALGEVQERKLRTFLASVIEYVVAVHNGDYRRKIQKFYKNFPKDGKFDISRTKQFSIEEIVSWTGVLTASGKRFNSKFFEMNGISSDMIDDAPEPTNGKPLQLDKKDDGRVQELGTRIRKTQWLS